MSQQYLECAEYIDEGQSEFGLSMQKVSVPRVGMRKQSEMLPKITSSRNNVFKDLIV